MEPFKIVFIVLIILAFILVVIFSGLSNLARFKAMSKEDTLFANSYESPTKDPVLLEPVFDIYGIWVFVYVYQMGLICYAVSLMLRPGAPDILQKKFYGCYLLALVFNIAWMFLWTNNAHALGFVFYALQAICLNVALYHACTSCHDHLQLFPNADETTNATDIWLIRSLVINGLAFFTGWISVTAFVDFSTVLQSELGVSQSAAAKASLSLLLVAMLLWSFVQNFVCELYTRFMFTEHFPVVVAIGGIIGKEWGHQHDVVKAYTIAVFIVSVMLLLFRLGFIMSKEIKRGSLLRVHHEAGENVKLF